ncbi:hypothetical protein RclHR1_16750001 [Rhizophagus clarus]|uniref:Uncharacterized protein n=1 Tax=Rhizophagus clarus TaxID=94130 RepID=A0A2Z6QMF2_9GLOM|nr:hypothetical protein RclHR1_16750001 [Rhizophagus clarus]GET01315.1 hypothetical protein GLOIN_2v1603334 [Rhizophagus clarus]
MTETTPTITPSTNINNTTTTTIIPPNVPPDNNNNSSEYQRSFSWKLPMVKVNRPKERSKSEYQREFTWKNDPPSTPSPAPSPAPIAPSPIPQESSCNTPEPIKSTSATTVATTNNNITIDYIGSKLNDLNITSNTTINNNISTINNNIVSEPDNYVFNTNNNIPDKWKDGLRSKTSLEQKQSSLASNLDPKTKKIVALEAHRLSKKSRSKSMYSLHDQLKVHEAADELLNPYDTEYNREFVNWKEYGTTVREDIKHQKTNDNHTLRRRGSWSAPASSSLPAPLKWLQDDLNSRANTREKLQPTIPDSKSIRGISSKSHSRLTRDNYYDEKRPTTSAEFRDYHYERPTTSADIRDYSRPMTSLNDYDDRDYYNSKRNSTLDYYSHSRKDDHNNTTPLRSSTTLGHYKDMNSSSKYYSNSDRKDYDYYDDHKYDKYDDRRREDIYDDHKRENVYDDRRRDLGYDDRRRDNVNDDRQRDYSSYDYEYRRRDNNNNNSNNSNNYYYDDYDSKYNRTVQQEHFNPGHSRNTSYASSNKGSIHDEQINYSGPPPSYLDAVRHRSSVSSLSSVSTPSSPATPVGYDLSDMRWKRNGLDPRIYKEQNYSPSVISKSSSGSNHKYWQFEDEKDKYYQPSVLSPSRNKFFIDDEEDDEHIGGYSSKRQSRDYKPSSMRYSSQYSPTPTRSSSPSRDSYGSGRKYYQKSANYSRPASRATSVSSHATSIEEESAVLTDLLKEAEMITLKNLTDQMSIFKSRDFGIGTKGVAASGRATPSVSGRATPAVSGRATPAVSGRATPSVAAAKRSSLVGQKKSTTTTTTTTTKAGVRSKAMPTTKTPTRTPTKTGATTTATKGTRNSSTPGIPPNKKKTHRPASSLSSISSTSSYREAYQPPPPPTNFSAARDALNKARMKVEEMLEIVSNGGSLD